MTESSLSRKWLHLPVEWHIREFQSKLLLAAFASIRGYSVLIGDQKLFRRNFHRLPKGIYLRKSFIPGQLDEIRQLKELGFCNIGCDEEFFAYYGAKGVSYFAIVRADSKTAAAVDRIFVWGNRLRAKFLELYPQTEGKLVVTGTPRLDLYRPEFRHIYRQESERYRDKYGRYILLNSNFAAAISFPDSNAFIRSLGKVEKSDEAELHRIAAARYEHIKKSLRNFVEVLPAVRKAFPDHTIIVRPHFADRIDWWKDTVAGIPRCLVIRENHVAPWLLGADAVFHHGCSTSVEAWMLGIPTVAYLPDDDGEFIEVGAMVGERTSTPAELTETLKRVAGKRDCQREGHEWLSELFAGTTGATACERTLDALDDLPIAGEKFRYHSIQPWQNLSGFKRFERQFRYFRDRHLVHPARTVRGGSSWKPHAKWPDRISREEIVSQLEQFAKGNSMFENIQVRQVDDQLFNIYV